MDLGLNGRKAVLCASSRGLGKACALALAREGCRVVINGLDAEHLSAAAAEIADRTRHTPIAIQADITTEEGRKSLIAACPDPDILINNNAGPAPGRMSDWDHDTWITALEGNMLAAVLLLQAVVPGMRKRGFGRIVNITSAMVKSPKLPMGLSTAPRAALTAFSKALAREAIEQNVTINNLLPERIETDRLRYMTEQLAKVKKLSFEEARREMLAPIAAGRFGTPEEFADACAFLCSAQAGYITGQNLQLDGGAYEGLF